MVCPMKVTFVIPPNHRYDFFDFAPPLGALVLARIAMEEGFQSAIVDMSFPSSATRADCPSQFYAHATRLIADSSPDILAITSMGVNSHVTLEIARRVKKVLHGVTVLAGGVNFSSIHDRLREISPWVDTVIAGEGERGFRHLLRRFRKSPRYSRQYLDDSAPDSLAHPHDSYDLLRLGEYFSANPRCVVDYEGERGCIYKCKFCYSPSHYDLVKKQQPEVIASDMTILSQRGAKHVFMVQDNFVNDRKYATTVLQEITAAKLPLTWNCYASLPGINHEVVEKLAAARCTAVYLGIDAVSKEQQRTFGKSFFRGSTTFSTLRHLSDACVMPTCAFMVDVYNWEKESVEATLRTALHCASLGLPIRINSFTRYPGTALGSSLAWNSVYAEDRVRIMLDCPEAVATNLLAQGNPHLFPFHSTEIDVQLWRQRLLFLHAAQNVMQASPQTLLDFSSKSDISLTDLFTRFVLSHEWRGVPKTEMKSCERELFFAFLRKVRLSRSSLRAIAIQKEEIKCPTVGNWKSPARRSAASQRAQLASQ